MIAVLVFLSFPFFSLTGSLIYLIVCFAYSFLSLSFLAGFNNIYRLEEFEDPTPTQEGISKSKNPLNENANKIQSVFIIHIRY